MNTSTVSVSVVVNVFNEAHNIGPMLDGLVAQSYDDFEVVLVDDGSSDDTRDRAAGYDTRLNLRMYWRPHEGLQAARAFGVAASRGDICVILDADQLIPEDCIAKFVAAFRDERVGAVGARRVSWGDGWVVTGRRVISDATWRLRSDPAGDLRWATGGACAYRAAALDQVGGLASTRHTAEDLDISWRLQDAGWRVVARDDIVIQHRDPRTLRELWRWSAAQGETVSQTFISHPRRMLDWRFWTRFYPLALALSVLLLPPVGLLGIIATFSWAHVQLRQVSDRWLDRSLAWLVFTVQNAAWSVGFARALLRGDR